MGDIEEIRKYVYRVETVLDDMESEMTSNKEDYENQIENLNLTIQEKNDEIEDLNTTINEYLQIIEEKNEEIALLSHK